MARAKTDPTRSGDAASKASSPWLLLEDVFQRWRVRLKLGQEAMDEVYALLCDRETRSRNRRVDASGEEISDTVSFLNAQFWQDHGALLSVVPDADGVGDRLGIDYTDAAEIYWPDGHWEFSVRRLDVERWEGLYPALAAPPTHGPSTEVEPLRKRGAKERIQWDRIKTEMLRLMDHHGDFSSDDPDWNAQARLEEALKQYCQGQFSDEPSDGALRQKLPDWLAEWRYRKSQGISTSS